MGCDTNLVAFDKRAFDQLDSGFQAFLDRGGHDAPLALALSGTPESLNSIRELIRSLPSANDRPSVLDLGCRLFSTLCAPVRFSFTSSPLCRYFYTRSQVLEHLFCAGGLEGRDMSRYLGEGATLLEPGITRTLWTEIQSKWPEPHQLGHPNELPDLNDLAAVGECIDPTTFDNLAIAYY